MSGRGPSLARRSRGANSKRAADGAVGRLSRPAVGGDGLFDDRESPATRPRRAPGTVLRDGAADTVGRRRVLVGHAFGPGVVGGARRDRLARDRSAAFRGVEDERRLRAVGPDRPEELDAVPPGRLAVGDDRSTSPSTRRARTVGGWVSVPTGNSSVSRSGNVAVSSATSGSSSAWRRQTVSGNESSVCSEERQGRDSGRGTESPETGRPSRLSAPVS